ncbi:hypothetical protein L1987_72981 [Smallanthus sonchifolius]|uniref:Uncharacterized protein n=1 Tax=Smallanthus sonchifolius TaxID=185202 RepID=A0ACB9AWR5_9ASTR|nr:hypothetical protein L1987_72981 [Smallanthus sonchifolius]
MILVITFVSVFLSLLHSATYANTSKPICPESFSCPDFGPFQFPFYNTTDTRCRLIKVNCTSGNESIQLGGQSYKIIGKYSHSHRNNSVIIIRNSTFQKLIERNNCEALMYNFTSPTPHLFSISIKPLMTLFKCPKHPDYSAQVFAYFNQPNYNSYNRCKHHNFYYKHPISPFVPSDIPHSCQLIQLPGRVPMENGQVPNYTDIFSLLTSQISISFRSLPCEDCYKKGGQCHQNQEIFQCLDGKEGKQDEKLNGKEDKKLILILVLTGSAFIFMLSTAIFLIWRRYKNNSFSYYLSKDKSPNPEDGSLFFGVSVFSYTELENATKNFDPSHELGDGGFGAVYYGKLQDGRQVALIDPVLGSNSNPEIKNMITSVAELAFRCLQFDSDMRPTMNEVLDALMEIQTERRTDAGDNIRDLETANPPPLSEVLLKDFPPSPVSVTRQWLSDNSASTTVSSNGDRLPMKFASVTI